MKFKSSTESYIEHLTAVLLTIFAVLLLIRGEYGWSVICLTLLLVLAKLDTLKSLTMSPKDGLKAEFDRKIVENIRENKEQVTLKTYSSYREVEDRVAKAVRKRYGADAEVLREYTLKANYRADIYVKTPKGDEMYEVKVVRSSAVADHIVHNAIHQLRRYAADLPAKPKLHLILASQQKINLAALPVPDDITVEYFQL